MEIDYLSYDKRLLELVAAVASSILLRRVLEDGRPYVLRGCV